MKAGTAVFGFVVVGALCFFVGYKAGQNQQLSPVQKAAVRAEADPGKGAMKPAAPVKADLFNIGVGDAPCKGPADAKVTIIEFSDFQCPFCSKVEGTIDEVRKNYATDVRVCFKQNPLPFHQDAPLAAEAALAAHDQGKFWEMHGLLFRNQQALKRENLERYAEQLGLDLGKFKTALDGNAHKEQIGREQAEAAKYGARGTPAFFINGSYLSGAQPYDKFREQIEAGLARANALLEKGVARAQLYGELVKTGLTGAAAAPQAAKQAQPGEGTGRQMVPVTSSDSCKGAKDPLVTIVEFSDFQCPFCSRVVPTIDQIVKAYPKEVRFCFKQNPLPFHQDAGLAAEATLAAGEQGKFWEMHDLLFKNQQALKRENLDAYGRDLKLNAAKYKAALDGGTTKARIADDQKLAAQLGARGTPTFFINGKKVAGALPFESFKATIDDEIKAANALKKKGVKPADLYAELVKSEPWKPAAAPAAAPAQAEAMPDDKPVSIDVQGSYLKGPRNAKVIIAVFSEFQCPYCKRAAPTVAQILKEYEGKVAVAFKHNPLPFHNNADNASKAALAAGEQNKFWEMHDKLFDNQQALAMDDLERYARELGLDVNRFKADMDSSKVTAAIAADKAEAARIGARGTPTFFINGRRLVGAQPVDAFKAIIDEELKK